MSLIDDNECLTFRPSRMRPYTAKPEATFARPSDGGWLLVDGTDAMLGILARYVAGFCRPRKVRGTVRLQIGRPLSQDTKLGSVPNAGTLKRHQVTDRMFNKLKNWRRIATRYDNVFRR